MEFYIFFTGTPLIFHWNTQDFPSKLHKFFSGVPQIFQWNYTNFSTGIPQIFYKYSTKFLIAISCKCLELLFLILQNNFVGYSTQLNSQILDMNWQICGNPVENMWIPIENMWNLDGKSKKSQWNICKIPV